MTDREKLIDELATMLNSLPKHDKSGAGVNYYLFNRDHSLFEVIYKQYAQKYKKPTPLGDIERFTVELSMLTDASLKHFHKLLTGDHLSSQVIKNEH